MATAEVTLGTFTQAFPNAGEKIFFIQGTGVTNSDWITVTGLTKCYGAYVIATDGTVGTITIATNKVTITNAGTKTWSGIAWGD